MRVQATNSRPRFEVTCDGEGMVSHAGAALLVELADRLGLTAALGWRAGRGQPPRHRHDAGAVLRDLAVMLAGGGDCSATWPPCATSRPCSARSPRPRPPGGWWSRSPPTSSAWPACGRPGPRPAGGPGRRARTPTGCCWSTSTARWSPRIPTSRALPAPTRAASGSTRWCASLTARTAPARPWPGFSGRATPAPTPRRPHRGRRSRARATPNGRPGPADRGARRHRRRHPRLYQPSSRAWRAVLDQPAGRRACPRRGPGRPPRRLAASGRRRRLAARRRRGRRAFEPRLGRLAAGDPGDLPP